MKNTKDAFFTKKDLLWFIGWLAFLFILFNFFISLTTVQGASMEPTLHTGEKTIGFRTGKIQRFDVVTFHAPDDKDRNYVKRVIGEPGDHVQFITGKLILNGTKVEENYLSPENLQATEDFEIIVPANNYFVMGDNRQASKDSRRFGPISEKSIIGRVKTIYWPIRNFGEVN